MCRVQHCVGVLGVGVGLQVCVYRMKAVVFACMCLRFQGGCMTSNTSSGTKGLCDWVVPLVCHTAYSVGWCVLDHMQLDLHNRMPVVVHTGVYRHIQGCMGAYKTYKKSRTELQGMKTYQTV